MNFNTYFQSSFRHKKNERFSNKLSKSGHEKLAHLRHALQDSKSHKISDSSSCSDGSEEREEGCDEDADTPHQRASPSLGSNTTQ